eukprot:IDg11627t1
MFLCVLHCAYEHQLLSQQLVWLPAIPSIAQVLLATTIVPAFAGENSAARQTGQPDSTYMNELEVEAALDSSSTTTTTNTEACVEPLRPIAPEIAVELGGTELGFSRLPLANQKRVVGQPSSRQTSSLRSLSASSKSALISSEFLPLIKARKPQTRQALRLPV